MRDGWFGEHTPGTSGGSNSDFSNILQIECKNYLSGVTKTVFKEIVNRVRPSCPVSILFASELSKIFTSDGSWNNFTESILESRHEIAFLTLGRTTGTNWLVVEGGNLTLLLTVDTKLLFVLVETGAFH